MVVSIHPKPLPHYMFQIWDCSYRSGPSHAVLVASTGKDNKPEEGHDETEHRDEHHPALGILWLHMSGSY